MVSGGGNVVLRGTLASCACERVEPANSRAAKYVRDLLTMEID